jgi:hypothetical protein
MGHFAKIKNGVVEQVIVAEEEIMQELSKELDSNFLQTSYNTRGGIYYDPATGLPSNDQSKAFRKNYAGIGYVYDEQRDAFIPPKPSDSSILDEETCLWNEPN